MTADIARDRGSARSVVVAVGLFALLVAAIALFAVRYTFDQARAREGARVQSVAALRAEQIAQWLGEQADAVRFVGRSAFFGELFARWTTQGDREALDRLLQRLAEFGASNRFAVAFLVDATGRPIVRAGETAPDVSEALQRAALAAIETGEARHVEPENVPGANPERRIDFVAPLTRGDGRGPAAIVLRADTDTFLVPLLKRWPIPSESAETILWKLDGDVAVSVSSLRFPPPGGGPLRVPARRLVAGRVLLGEAPDGQSIEGPDYRGVRSFGTALRVARTSWVVAAKLDVDEMLAPARIAAAWIVATALLLVLTVAVGAYLLRARQSVDALRRRAAEQAERVRTLSLLGALAEASTDAIFTKDRAGRYAFANPATHRLFGRDPVGLDDAALFSADAAARIATVDRAVIETGASHTEDASRVLPVGERHFLTTKGPLRDADGQVIGLFGIARDVTEARGTADALRRLSLVVEQSPSGVAITDLDARVIYANAAYERVTGRGAGDLIGRYSRALRRDDATDPPSAALAALRAGQLWRSLFTDQRPDGTSYTVQVIAAPIRDVTGRVTQYMVIKDDVTERERMAFELERHRNHLEELVSARTRALEQAIAEREESERFAALIAANVPGRIAYWDRDLRCRFVNELYCRFFERRREDIVDRTMPEVFGAEVFARVEPQVRAVLAGVPQRSERPGVDATGAQVSSLVHYTPDRRDGAVVGFFVLATDITELKATEARLQRLNEEVALERDRADAANRAKSAFLANMSHEIRTPMNAIIGLTHLMQQDTTEPLQLRRLTDVSEAAHHLLAVINDILDLSKIEAGKLRLEVTDFSLDELLSRTCALVGERARAQGLEMILDTDGLPDMLRGDPTRLSQAILNLLSNAVKFTPSGSVLLKVETLPAESGGIHAKFVVRDSGIGIPAEKLGGIFEAFEQADSSTTRRYGGTGLGLSITRHVARMFGGTVGVESEEGVGSTFWFTAHLERATMPRVAPRLPALEGLRALLVDDLAEARLALGDMLRRLGFAVEMADSGEAAVARWPDLPPCDVVLIDWQMPGLDGIETLERLRATAAAAGRASVPAILVTANDDAVIRQTARAAGFQAVLLKPVTPSTLYDALLQLMRPKEAPRRAALPAATVFAEAAIRERFAGRRVLLAEDNLVNREVARQLLVDVKLVVDTATTGAGAVALAERNRYDVILMDMQMPEMDGLEATRVLRTRPLGAKVPIVAMTANAFGEDRDACLAAGMNDHLGKPVEPAVLYATMLKWLSVPQWAPSSSVDDDASATAGATPPVQPGARDPLDTIDGLDLAAGLARFANRRDAYERVLAQFVALYADGLPEMTTAIAVGDIAAVHRIAHSVRGAAGAIGAHGVEHAAKTLELGIARGEPPERIEAWVRALVSALEALVVAIGPALPPPGIAPAAMPDDAALDRLEAMLATADFSASDALRAAAGLVRVRYGAEALRSLEQLIGQFDFARALQVVVALRQGGADSR